MNPPAYDRRKIDEILNDAARVATRVAAAERDLIRAQDEQDAVYAAVKDMLLTAGKDSTHWTSPDGRTEYTATHGDYGRIQVTETISRDRLADILVGGEASISGNDDEDPAAWPTLESLNPSFADSIPIRMTGGREPVIVDGEAVATKTVTSNDEAISEDMRTLVLSLAKTPSDHLSLIKEVACGDYALAMRRLRMEGYVVRHSCIGLHDTYLELTASGRHLAQRFLCCDAGLTLRGGDYSSPVARINAKLADPGRRQAIPINADDYRDTINLVDEGQVAS